MLRDQSRRKWLNTLSKRWFHMVEFGTKLVEGCTPDRYSVCSEETLFKGLHLCIYSFIRGLGKGLVRGERDFRYSMHVLDYTSTRIRKLPCRMDTPSSRRRRIFSCNMQVTCIFLLSIIACNCHVDAQGLFHLI